MFAYPKQAEVNRIVPKARIYAHGKVSKRVKELFATQVAEIVWKYKLSPETINLPACKGINEIQVFEIALKSTELDSGVLQAIDKGIPFPLLFELTHGGEIRFAASFKQPAGADASKWIIEASFETELQPSNAERLALPVALDLASLYEQIIRRHIPLPSRPAESITEHVARFIALEAKKKMQAQLESRLGREKQFNRKVELNAALRSLSKELKTLMKC
jgi:hypothetical protein